MDVNLCGCVGIRVKLDDKVGGVWICECVVVIVVGVVISVWVFMVENF